VLLKASAWLQQKWVVLACLTANSFVVGGLCAVAIGLLISPLMSEFGWPNGRTSGIATAFNLTSYLAAPVVGIALDKLGARSVMSFGALATAAGFLLVSRCHSWHTMLGAFVLAGIGFCATFYVPSAVVVANWMGSRRSLAMGIIMGAMSAGAALFSLVIGGCIEAYGWRFTVEVIAVLVALMFPVVLTVGTRPSVEPRAAPIPERASGVAARRDLWLSPAFSLTIASSALFSMGMGGIYFHVVSVLVKGGYSAYWAGIIFGSTWVFSGLGSLGLGIMADRFGAKAILAAALLSCAIGPLFLLVTRDAGIGIASISAFVILWGTPANGIAQFIPIVFRERFGSANLGRLIGAQQAVAGVVGAITPIITGLLYDQFKDYHLAIYLSVSEMLIAFICVLLIRAPTSVDGAPGTRSVRVAA
jgi:MFS family permease